MKTAKKMEVHGRKSRSLAFFVQATLLLIAVFVMLSLSGCMSIPIPNKIPIPKFLFF